MKYLVLFSLVIVFFASAIKASKNLKSAPQKNLTPINSKSGRLSNIAPEAKGLVTAQLASPKAEIKLNINHMGIVQKSEHLATTPTLGYKRGFDPKTKEWFTEPAVINHKIYATTTKVANMNTYHTVNIDLTTGNAIPKTGAKPTGTFGTR